MEIDDPAMRYIRAGNLSASAYEYLSWCVFRDCKYDMSYEATSSHEAMARVSWLQRKYLGMMG